MEKKRRIIIAIDGPVGSGKSTVAKLLAKKLGFLYIDTGAMYRAVALKVFKKFGEKILNINIENIKNYKKDIIEVLKNLDIKLTSDGKVFLDGEDITSQIRTPEISKISSPISAIPEVRKRLVELQRKMGEKGSVVMEGRDIGTVVFPDAELKIFLTASLKERAKRRYLELKEKGFKVSLKKIEEEIKIRDFNDSTRKIAPLKKTEEHIEIDTTNKSIKEVVGDIENLVNCVII
jgi:cytidylate kinase